MRENWKCPECGWEGLGIVDISGHWAECGGKPIMDAIMKLKQEDKLSLVNVKKILEQYATGK